MISKQVGLSHSGLPEKHEYPRGLGMDLNRFENIQLLPAAKKYRSFLDEATEHYGWEIGAAIVTIFVEGTKDERAVLNSAVTETTLPPLEEHPLVKHYGIAIKHLALTKAHRQVEGRHRLAAWTAILDHVAPTRRGPVIRAMTEAVEQWLAYRDAVAEVCGVRRTDGEYGAGVAA